MVMGTRRIDILIAIRVQQTGDMLIAAYTRYSGDDLDTRAIHPSQWKITKRQWTGIRPIVVGTRHANGKQSNTYQHVADRLQSDGCVTMNNKAEGCC